MPKNKIYPISEVFYKGRVEVQTNYYLYFEQRGNPQGIPVVCNHGGPGGIGNSFFSSWFNPKFYNIILYDQRGSERFEPSLKNPKTSSREFKSITIDDMALDLEKLRQHLNIEKWLVFGGSWGSALSLYYAQTYSKAVSGLIIMGIFLYSIEEIINNHSLFLFDKPMLALAHSAAKILADYAAKKDNSYDSQVPFSFLKVYYQLCVENDDPIAQYLYISFADFMDNPSLENFNLLQKEPPYAEMKVVRTRSILSTTLFSKAGQVNLLDHCHLQALSGLTVSIIQGKSDTTTPPKYAEKLVHELKKAGVNVTFDLVEGGHFPVPEDETIGALLQITDDFASHQSKKLMSSIPSITTSNRWRIFNKPSKEKSSWNFKCLEESQHI